MRIASPADRTWRVIAGVCDWPRWNPLVEWTSTEILGTAERFTLLSARTLLEAEVQHVIPYRTAHLRCSSANRPQPPAVDCSVALGAGNEDGTFVIARFNIESWFLQALAKRVDLIRHTPATLYLASLARVVSTTPV